MGAVRFPPAGSPYSTSSRSAAPAVVIPAPGLPPFDSTLPRNPEICGRQADPVPAVDAWTQAKGGSDPTDEFVEANLGFVFRIAGEYRNLGLPLEDLVNEGNLGLIEAARRFDPTRGTRFISYAVWWIRKSIREALTRGSANVYVPEYQLKKVRRLRSAENRLSRRLGREADREEVSHELGIKTTQIDAILRIKMRELSLTDTVGATGETPLSDVLVDENSINPEEGLIRRETRRLVQRALLHLSDQEQVVIINHFGLGGGPTFTLREIGDRLGVSRERARQIEAKSKKQLRGVLEGRRRAWSVGHKIHCAGGNYMSGR